MKYLLSTLQIKFNLAFHYRYMYTFFFHIIPQFRLMIFLNEFMNLSCALIRRIQLLRHIAKAKHQAMSLRYLFQRASLSGISATKFGTHHSILNLDAATLENPFVVHLNQSRRLLFPMFLFSWIFPCKTKRNRLYRSSLVT